MHLIYMVSGVESVIVVELVAPCELHVYVLTVPC